MSKYLEVNSPRTVGQLIDELQKIEDKSLKVRIDVGWLNDKLYVAGTELGLAEYDNEGLFIIYGETEEEFYFFE